MKKNKVIIRKHHKRQVLDVLEVIEEAQQNGAFQAAQDGIEAVLDFVDGLYNEDTELINLLVKHFELLYKASIGEVDNKYLLEHFILIKNAVQNDFKPNHIEIAFLPHIASMSDSLESIYLAANEDPDCDAYWVPIPYYELNAEKEVKKQHFEGQEHYLNIPCVSWEDYSIEERRPDAIFTFFPYEYNNFITGLPDDFLCERLKNLTDMLVYVPYYVNIDEFTYYEAETFYPAFVHVHRAIVETEVQRDAIIKEFRKKFGDALGDPNEKFVAMGSPKYDKVINTSKENSKLPKEWEDIINGRKVIVYISSVGNVGEDKDYLKKTIETLSAFQNRDDIVLWWRPHPVMEMWIELNSPQAGALYKKIIRNYKAGAYGIYDDTSDLHRAIAWGDGLFGDISSVMLLYRVTGKPAMMANTCGKLYKKMKQSYTKLGGFRFEDETDTLEIFIDDIVNGKFAANPPIIEANAGKNIYSYIKNLVME